MAVLTLGDIARQHHADKDRVAYLIRSRGIKPIGRAGHYRLFNQAASDAVGRLIDEIDAKRIARELEGEQCR
ncbi:hypothetical protein [Botrimarina sp.]|uniref:hypothetical protein n=1 Tax=Botrimarina sp. TaxID=2795802 RepID=UPI0032ECC1F5